MVDEILLGFILFWSCLTLSFSAIFRFNFCEFRSDLVKLMLRIIA